MHQLPTTPVREWRDVTLPMFREEIMPLAQPALLRGLVDAWPAVRAGRESPMAAANYLRGFDNSGPVNTMHADPAIGGHFFYNSDLTGHNFERRTQPLAATRERLIELIPDPAPPWRGSPFEALLHAIMSIRALPPERRAIWRTVFDHYIFQTGGDPVAHLTPPQRGVQGVPSPQIADLVRAQLVNLLSRRR